MLTAGILTSEAIKGDQELDKAAHLVCARILLKEALISIQLITEARDDM